MPGTDLTPDWDIEFGASVDHCLLADKLMLVKPQPAEGDGGVSLSLPSNGEQTKMKQEGRNMKLSDSYIECMKVFNDTVNKNNDPSMVPQEDLLNHKPLVLVNLEQPSSFKKTLETLRQDWYDPPASPSDGKPCKEKLHLKQLGMEGVGGDHQWPNPYLQNMLQVYQEV
ncbi:hypothetical protein R1flu_022548 [Riccia fluitans]|uniref:Uncharacterized protein n=1 Tax=Riccia fluitans TaxID=41844 RepID=A0ABD1XSI0_9MARC